MFKRHSVLIAVVETVHGVCYRDVLEGFAMYPVVSLPEGLVPFGCFNG